MLYQAFKTLLPLSEPAGFLFLLSTIGIALFFVGAVRWGVGCLIASALILGAITALPVGQSATHVLETRFPKWVDTGQKIDGIVLLSGSIPRIYAAAKLANRFPQARIIAVTGVRELGETDITLKLFDKLGIPRSRLEFDGTSHNTFENAEAAKRIAQPHEGEHWLLVTSALHMPRAMGCFQAVGFDVEPYPTNYTQPEPPLLWAIPPAVSQSLSKTSAAVHEFVGLAAYRLAGRTSRLFPGPDVRTTEP